MRHAFGLLDFQDQFLTGCLWLDRLDRSRDRLLRFDRHRNIERRRPERRRARTGHAGSDRGCDRESHPGALTRSEEHTSELQSLMRISYAVFCLKKKNKQTNQHTSPTYHKKHINTAHTTKLTRD